MKKKRFLAGKLAIILVATLVSCNPVPTEKNQTGISDQISDSALVEKMEAIYYSMPSPAEIICYFDKKGVSYKPELLNPLSNKEKYIRQEEKILNIGIYSADISYQVFFEKTKSIGLSLNVFEDLCNAANIPAVLDDILKRRIVNCSNDPDSLTNIFNTLYLRTINIIHESGKENTYVLLAAGSFIETMFLIINSVNNYAESENTINKIIEQKLLFTDLYATIESLKSDKNMAVLLSDFSDLKNAFDVIIVQSENVQMKKSEDGSLVLSGKNNISYTKESYNNLKSSIVKLRTKWTEN